jgi:hypothetical protein
LNKLAVGVVSAAPPSRAAVDFREGRNTV